MYNRRTTVLPLLAAASMLLTGFSWGLGGNPCKEALELANRLPTVSDDTARTQDEAKVLLLCPNGAAAAYVQGAQSERIGNQEAAIAAYRRALQQEPEFAAASGSLGILYQRQGQLDDAAVALTRGIAGQPLPIWHKALAKVMADKKFPALALYHYGAAARSLPSDPEIIAGQADVYAAQGQTDRAVDELQRALVLSPSHEQASFSLAGIYQQQGKQDAALELLKQATHAHPRSSRLHLLLADIYEQKGDAKQAEYERLLGGKKPDKSVKQQPRLEGIALGDQLAAKGDLERAAEAYQAELKRRPGAIEPLERLGDMHFTAGRDADALLAYREATHAGSTKPEVFYRLGLLYERRNQLDEAVVSYKRATEYKPDYAEAHLRLADIRYNRGNIQEAIEQYVAFLRLKPESADIHLKLARIYAKNKQPAKADEAYMTVLKLAPANPEANRELAELCRGREQYDRAADLYRAALALNRNDAESRNALVALYVRQKKYDELTVLLKEAVEITPDDANNHYKLGLIHDFRKEHDSAIEEYKKATELKPDHARALHALGRVYMKTGRLSEAREALEAAKKADPGMEETSVLLNNIKDEFNPTPRKAVKSKKSKKVIKGKKSKSKAKSTKKATTKKPSSKKSTSKAPTKKTR